MVAKRKKGLKKGSGVAPRQYSEPKGKRKPGSNKPKK